MYPILFVFIVWSLYLLNRLRKFTRIASAFRYSIPTAIITWNTIEILGRWNIFTEVWIEPQKYTVHVLVILTAFVTVAVIFALLPPGDRPDDGVPEARTTE